MNNGITAGPDDAPTTIKLWLFAICSCLALDGHDCIPVNQFLHEVQFRPGPSQRFPLSCQHEEQELAQLDFTSDELLHAGRVVARASRRWPMDY